MMWKWEVDHTKAKGVFVIVHGAGEYHARYKWIIEQLNRMDYHVIMGDLPGQGTTPGPRGHVPTFDLYIETVNKWLKEAKEYDLPTILFGHSMGGLISTRTLMKEDVNYLPDMVILSSPCFGLFNKTPFSKKTVSLMLNKVTPSLRFNSALEPGSGTRDPQMRARDEKDNLLIKKVSIRWYRELENSIKFAHQHVDTFPEIPLLVMQGGDDRIVSKFRVKEWFNRVDISDKYYKEWEGLYHEVLNEPEKSQVMAHMLGFVTMHVNK
ncbi:alpha/beta hydrolase [Salipaludibacillus daqingensis]|uniref:alpha/beta hydrolase n=1 Tax=Salipaludibacillus daqingensis TaxID=3041001 RepID=UPI002475BDB5|nr:alpha/beta hydrolase [Salipaludibacillus daqingensis]